MTTKNTATNTTTTTKAKAIGTKPVATPKKDKPVATPIKEEPEKVTMSTDVFSKEILTELNKRTKSIKDSINKIDSSFEAIAFNLYWIHAKEAYKAKGADSIAKYASDMFGYEKTTCYSLISIVDRFAKRDENGNYLEEFDPRYKGYSSSKLSLMVGLTDEQIEGLKPEMSVRDIKKYVASLKPKALPPLSDGNGDEDNGGDDNDNVVDSTAIEIHRQHLFTVNGFDDYNKKLDKIDETIHKLYKEMPDLIIRIEIERNQPFTGKWGK